MNYAYIRVSTDKQTVEHQRTMITARNYEISKWYEDEAVSGKISWKKRKICTLLRRCEKGDKIIVAELSRLGRSLRDILEIVERCQRLGIVIVCIRENIELSDDNPMTKLLISIMGSLAELERNLISQRTKDAMANLKAQGKHLGRKRGYKFPRERLKLYEKEDKIIKYVNEGLSWSEMGRRLKISHTTVQRYVFEYMPEYKNYRKKEVYETTKQEKWEDNHNREYGSARTRPEKLSLPRRTQRRVGRL